MKFAILLLTVNVLSAPVLPKIFNCVNCFKSAENEIVDEARVLAKQASNASASSRNSKLEDELAQMKIESPSRKWVVYRGKVIPTRPISTNDLQKLFAAASEEMVASV